MSRSATMKAILLDSNKFHLKFKGSLYGGLIGDCTGAPYEGDQLKDSDKSTLKKYFDKLEGPMFKSPRKSFTDDTAQTKCVLRCLIKNKAIEHKFLATEFVKEYFTNPNRGYGRGTIAVLTKLRQTKALQPLKPAQEAFGGIGSHGNGAAMRITPVALFCYNKPDKLQDMVIQSSLVTHANSLAINGAILQALAVHYCVNLVPEEFNTENLLNYLIDKMGKLEQTVDEFGLVSEKVYEKKLNDIKQLLKKEDPSIDELMNKLGNNATALNSVPTALYCFLRAHKEPFAGFGSSNPLRRTLEFAITLGGDTDTIASMAGSICGALYGEEVVSENILAHCEDFEDIRALAEELYYVSAQ